MNPSDDQLLLWLFTVARRADELSTGLFISRDVDRRTWLRAEFELFERTERRSRVALLEQTV
jgi:hypothetical protein